MECISVAVHFDRVNGKTGQRENIWIPYHFVYYRPIGLTSLIAFSSFTDDISANLPESGRLAPDFFIDTLVGSRY